MGKKLRDLFMKHREVMLHLEIQDARGDYGSGSAFHVGEGVFVTARHVVEGKKVTAITLTECCGEPPRLAGEPLLHPDPAVDVAVLKVANIHGLEAAPLGGHLDDWLVDRDWVLTRALVLGYPPIPFATGPVLVAATAELHCILDVRGARHPLFILSAIPRGGFSGGLVISEHGFVLGVVTESLVHNGGPAETGFFGCLTVEPIFQCLAHHNLLPKVQREGWEDLWNSEMRTYGKPMSGGGIQATAFVTAFDDGATRYIEISCQDPLLQMTVATAVLDKVPAATSLPVERSGVRIAIPCRDALTAATHEADALITKAGLQASGNNTLQRHSLSAQA
jgi:hypothetical protein